MILNSQNDPLNPVAQAYRKWYRRLRNIGIAIVAMVLIVVFWGCPSIQYTYRYPKGIRGTPKVMDKTDADYFNPIVGWKTVRAGEHAPGCPFILFMPLRDCMDLSPYKNSFTLFVFKEEFFDGPQTRP